MELFSSLRTGTLAADLKRRLSSSTLGYSGMKTGGMGTSQHTRLVDLLNESSEADSSAPAAFSSRAAEFCEGDSLIVLSQTDSLASLKNKLSFRKRSQSSDKLDINRLESLVRNSNGSSSNANSSTPSTSKTFHVADLQSYNSNSRAAGSSSTSKLPSARSMAKAKHGAAAGPSTNLFSQDDADPLAAIYNKIDDNNRLMQSSAPAPLALANKSPKASKRLQNAFAERGKDGPSESAGDKEGSSTRKSSIVASSNSGGSKILIRGQSSTFDGLVSKDSQSKIKAVSLINPPTSAATNQRLSSATSTTDSTAVAVAAAPEIAATVNDKAKANVNDKILSDRLQEAKALQRKPDSSGAVVHQFALWSNVKKAKPCEASSNIPNPNLPSPNSILKNKLANIISESSNFTIDEDLDAKRGGSKLRVHKAALGEESTAPAAESDALLITTPQRVPSGGAKSSSSSLASALRNKVGHAKSLHQSSDSLSPMLSHHNSNASNTNYSSSVSLLSPKTSKSSVMAGDSSPESSLVTKYSEDFCELTVDGEGAVSQAAQGQASMRHGSPPSSVDADDLSVEEDEELRLLSTIKRTRVHSTELLVGGGARFAASKFDDKSDAEVIEMAEGVSIHINALSEVMSFMPIAGAEVSSTDYLAGLGDNRQSQSLLEASSPLSELSANGSDVDREEGGQDDIGHRVFDSQRTYKKSSGSSSGWLQRNASPEDGALESVKANVNSSSGNNFRDASKLINIIDEKCAFRWKIGKTIGEGTFGKVYRGLNDSTGELLAVKQLMISDGSGSDVRELRNEITIMRDLQHDNIVRYLGTSQSERSLYILIEFVSGGSIENMLAQFGPFSEPLLRRFSYQILCGVQYLHSKGIIHRDIKGANVLVTESGVAKLADFGCSKQLVGMCTNSLEESMRAIRGSVPWMAPEVIKQSGHGRSADIWSVGATVIEMATGRPPWPEFTNNLAALFHVATSKEPPPVPTHLSAACSAFIKRCLVIEPKDRSTSQELVAGDVFFDTDRGGPGRQQGAPTTPLKGAAIRSSGGEELAPGADETSPSVRLAYEVSLAESLSI